MFYIHRASCISPQHTFSSIELKEVIKPVRNKLLAIEPTIKQIPANLLRRMSKGVRISITAFLPLLDADAAPDGIIIGTVNVGMEESGKFLNQLVEFDEDTLSPGNFVQSTSNSIASQIGLMFGYTCYANTHVHGGLAFENAILDAAMLVAETPNGNFILGGADEITAYNYAIDDLAGWYKQDTLALDGFYEQNTTGTIAGEGAAMFKVSGNSTGALARFSAVEQLHTTDVGLVKQKFETFISKYLPGDQKHCLFLSGENGDTRLNNFYTACEKGLPATIPVARFKHLSGEYPTASSFAVWLSCMLLSGELELPAHMLKSGNAPSQVENVLIYNNYKGAQHSFMLLQKV